MATNTAGTDAQLYHTNQIHYLTADITYANDGESVTLGTIPAGSVVIRGGVVVSALFNGDTTNTLDIGTVADPDGFATAIALGTVGVIVADEMATTDDSYVTSDTVVTCAVTSTASATAGAGRVWIEYLPIAG